MEMENIGSDQGETTNEGHDEETDLDEMDRNSMIGHMADDDSVKLLEGSLFIWRNTCFPVVIPPERIPRNGKKCVTCFTRDLKQARTATAVNKQLNFTVKNKPHTTNYILHI